MKGQSGQSGAQDVARRTVVRVSLQVVEYPRSPGSSLQDPFSCPTGSRNRETRWGLMGKFRTEVAAVKRVYMRVRSNRKSVEQRPERPGCLRSGT